MRPVGAPMGCPAVSLVCTLLRVYLLVIFIRVIMSWIPTRHGGAAQKFSDVLHLLTEPVLGPVRRALPPLRTSTMAIDLSPIVVVVAISLISTIIC